MRDARALAAEAAGTFAIVAVACLAMTGGLGPLPNAAACGGVVAVAILAFAGASGAHFNPAVTLALAVAGRFAWPRVAGYVLAQLSAGVGAAWTVRLLAGDVAVAVKAGTAAPLAVLAAESATTLLLVATILAAVLLRWPRPLAALAIGAAVAIGVAAAWPVGAGGMNPARALGPALVAGSWGKLWPFVAAPLAAGLAVGAGSRMLARRPAATPEAA